MRVYTRGGDDGTTGLWGAARTRKSSPRIEAIGALDECNAHLGLCIVALRERHADLAELLTACQRDLFELGAELAGTEGAARVGDERVAELEREIDALSDAAPPLRHFILPGGSEAAARLHVARTVARRAERRLVALGDSGASVRPALIAYLNRLSDLLFVAARCVNAREEIAESIWSG